MRKLFTLLAVVAALSVGAAADEITVKGEVVDVACATKKAPGGKGDAHANCAMVCAKKGLPVGIMTDEAIYLVAGDYAADNNAKMLDFVAKMVEVKGEVGEKDGQKTITITSIKLAN